MNRLPSTILIALVLTASAPPAPAEPVVNLSAERVVAGTTLVVEIENSVRLSDLTLRFDGRASHLFHPSDTAAPHHWLGLVAVPFKSRTGPRALSVRWKEEGRLRQQLMAFQVTRGDYRSEELTVDPARVHPSKKDRDRAAREQREIRRIYADGHPSPFWRSGFQRPMESAVTSPFGNRRLFNGKLASYHGGMDFRAGVGTPVKAANRGIVKLTRNLFYAGNTVLIDHGAGVFTVYAHLSRSGVSVNQPVEKGQVIGRSGRSGRVSGPHLHWGVKLNGQNVDPLQFMAVISKRCDHRPLE